MSKVNYRTVDRSAYKSDQEFYTHIGTILGKLAQDGYVAVFEYDDVGIYAIEYDHANRAYGCPYPVWLEPEEENMVLDARAEKEEKKAG